jgi:CO/xanthine dehydrogenase Mo-binding subunit
MEELVMNNGTVLNPSFADYKIPTEKDVPKLNVIPLESETGYGPLKVRGIGDTPIVLVAPAIANAIADALDQPIESLPIKAADVYDLLKSKL